MNKTVIVATMCAVLALPLAASAGIDPMQQQLIQRAQESKKKLAAAEKAKGAERQKLMQEHMKMMQETMGKMRAMKPKVGMTMPERDEWMAEHQKLMDEMMGQMMQEHHMMMQDMGK
ncbi:MAG: hypothetical protein HY082_01850 [Gammaproteobacteria bacterium]|nr:hypothetical protein [Gammaproteobacteria bacterium]